MRQVGFATVLAGVLGLAAAPTALAVPCGQPAKEGDPPTAGTLTLNTENSDTDLDFEGKTDKDSLRLIFNVADCTLESSDGVDVRALTSGKAKSSFGKPLPQAKRTLLVIEIPVNASRFPAGEHKGRVIVSGSTVNSTIVKVSVKRKETPPVPVVVSVLALIAGFLWALYAAWVAARGEDGKKVEFKRRYLVIALGGSVAASYAVFKTVYVDATAWVADFPSIIAMAVAVMSASAGGATAGPVAKGVAAVIKKTTKRQPAAG